MFFVFLTLLDSDVVFKLENKLLSIRRHGVYYIVPVAGVLNSRVTEMSRIRSMAKPDQCGKVYEKQLMGAYFSYLCYFKSFLST